MKILIDINHPAHVHFFRNSIRILKEKGHEVIVTASSKDISLELLREYDIPFINIGKWGKSIFAKIVSLLMMDIRLIGIFFNYRPDVAMGIASTRICHASFFFKTRAYIFDDTEHAKLEIAMFKPFADKIFTPYSYTRDLGKKQVRYNGFHDLAYLHPDHFVPDSSILSKLGLKFGEKYFVVRFVSWGAAHDIGHNGFSDSGKLQLIELLNKNGKVFITSEARLPVELEKYMVKVSPGSIHHLLYYASMYVGEGGTMATEAALLGTPSVFVSTLTAGVFHELEEKYGLMFSFRDEKVAFLKIQELLQIDAKSIWKERKGNLLSEKVNVTDFIIQALISAKL